MAEVIITEEKEPLSVVVPVDDMREIINQLWKKCGCVFLNPLADIINFSAPTHTFDPIFCF